MIAKAVANSLADKLSTKRGEKINGYFLNVKGPELLNKYVGETERKIREIFQEAKEKAADDVPVVVFFDEMDALFRTRGTGISSDVEMTIVPQFLTELEGVEGLRNVVVIGASNRPDRVAAGDIFRKYLTSDLPIAAAEARQHGGVPTALEAMIESALEAMYSRDEDNQFLEVTYASGDKEVMYFKDFVSGAMIESVVRRRQQGRPRRQIRGRRPGPPHRDPFPPVGRGVQG